MKKVCVIGGDGIGPEVVGAALRVLDAVGSPLERLPADAGLACYQKHGDYLPEATLSAVREADAVLFGAITSPLDVTNYKSVILSLRNELDAYANVRPARDLGQPCKAPGLDLVLVRENTEGLYNAPEVEDAEGVTTMRRITKRGAERVTRFALELAHRQGRSRVTCLHKANVLRKSDALFRRVFYEQAKALGFSTAAGGTPTRGSPRPPPQADDMLLDNAALQLVLNPQKFDALVTMNLYGDVLSDEMAGLVGGLGFAPSGSYGPRAALFEPVHGSAPDIAGKGVANPCGAILSAAMMLDFLGMPKDARRVEDAVRAALAKGRTPDAGGSLSSEAFTGLVVAAVG